MSVFEEACYLSNQRWIASFPAEFEAIEFSKQHEKRMRILFDKMRRDKYHRFTKRATIALIAAILIISMTITAFAIPASRDYIIHKFFDHSTYTAAEGEHNEVGEITIGYIPEGFEIIDQYKAENVAYYEYQNKQKDWYQVKKTSVGSTADFDTEKQKYESVTKNGIVYIIYIDNNSIGCIWNNVKYTYIITGNISKELILKIAYSVN